VNDIRTIEHKTSFIEKKMVKQMIVLYTTQFPEAYGFGAGSKWTGKPL
jgi:hypothetical protein